MEDKYPPGALLRIFFCKETSATRLEERNSIKMNNIPLDEVVIKEKEEDPLAF